MQVHSAYCLLLRACAQCTFYYCAQVHSFCCALALTFVALPFPAWVALWAGSLFLYYALTAYGSPEHTGALLAGCLLVTCMSTED